MKKPYMEIPVVIRLKVSAIAISVDDIAYEIFVPLQRDLREKLVKYGSSFSCLYYAQAQRFSRNADFRCDLLDGLLPEPPWDEMNTCHIARQLESEDKIFIDRIRAACGYLAGEDLALAKQKLTRLLDAATAEKTRGPSSVPDMYRYIRSELPRRIYRMLDDDIETGKLVLSGPDKENVLLDHLVEWATGRAILIEQDPLAICLPLVVDSYSRLRQRMASATAAHADTSRRTNLPARVERSDAPTDRLKPAAPISRADAQKMAILTAIVARGMNPKCMPKHSRGHASVKADIRAHLTKTAKNVFQSVGTFNTAWQRLRDQEEVIDD